MTDLKRPAKSELLVLQQLEKGTIALQRGWNKYVCDYTTINQRVNHLTTIGTLLVFGWFA